ncbi:hypothetical protein OY671_007912, partial [Metschnikowia pulcherrima]
WAKNPLASANDPKIDCFVESMGGSGEPASSAIEAASRNSKSVVTANKASIAKHGSRSAASAEKHGGASNYEAAVGAAIPVIKTLREGLAGTDIHRVYGILNGTCNYILSTMEDTGRDFADVLAEAQAKGYAEADPTFDIDGIDAAHKSSISASVAFGTAIDFQSVIATGIRRVSAADIAQADASGYYIRSIGMAETDVDADGNRRSFQRVHPHLVHRDHPSAHVDGATNAVVVEGNFAGPSSFQGAGAGDGPTASAVVADSIDIARGDIGAPFSIPVAESDPATPAASGHRSGRAYSRFTVADRPGVLAEITAAMRDAGSSPLRSSHGPATNMYWTVAQMVAHHTSNGCD